MLSYLSNIKWRDNEKMKLKLTVRPVFETYLQTPQLLLSFCYLGSFKKLIMFNFFINKKTLLPRFLTWRRNMYSSLHITIYQAWQHSGDVGEYTLKKKKKKVTWVA